MDRWCNAAYSMLCLAAPRCQRDRLLERGGARYDRSLAVQAQKQRNTWCI